MAEEKKIVYEPGKVPKHWAKPFEKTNPDAEQDGGITKTIRLNEEELELLERQKDALDTYVDSKVIKFFWLVGWNVTQGMFGEKNLAWLTSRDRVRSLKKTKKTALNVSQKKEDL